MSRRLRTVVLVYGMGVIATEVFLLWYGIDNGGLERPRPDFVQNWLLPGLGHLTISLLWPLFWAIALLGMAGVIRPPIVWY